MIVVEPAGADLNRTERAALAALMPLSGVAVADLRVGGGGPGRRVRQLDIVLITPTGVAVVEVKGTPASGLLHAPDNGAWSVGSDTNPFHGRSRTTANPAAQADTGAKVLASTLRERGVDLGFVGSAVVIDGDVTVPGGLLWNGGTPVTRADEFARHWPTAHRRGQVRAEQVLAALAALHIDADRIPDPAALAAEGFAGAVAPVPSRPAPLSEADVAARFADTVRHLEAEGVGTTGPRAEDGPRRGQIEADLHRRIAEAAAEPQRQAVADEPAGPGWRLLALLEAPAGATKRRAFWLVGIVLGLLLAVLDGVTPSDLLVLAIWVPTCWVASVLLALGGAIRRAVTVGAVFWPEVVAAYCFPLWMVTNSQNQDSLPSWLRCDVTGLDPLGELGVYGGLYYVAWPLTAAVVFWTAAAVIGAVGWLRRRRVT